MIAANEAFKQSKLDFNKVNNHQMFIAISSAIGDFPMIEEQVRNYFAKGPGKMSPFTVPRISSNMALKESVVHPTINLDNPDPECDLNYVPKKLINKKLNYIMSNSFAFGGQNCVIIFKRW